MNYFRVMTIAGSDPSGGAGVQADIKTISALGCYASSAIVAVVDENTLGVTGVHPVPTEFVVGQIHSILNDIGTDAVKIGMLHSAELIRAVRNTLDEYPGINNIVLDPVMVATSGDPLLQNDAISTLCDTLIPRSSIITPNIPEAEILLGEKITHQSDLPDAARQLGKLGASVYLKSGHLTSFYPNNEEDMQSMQLTDIFYNSVNGELIEYIYPVVQTLNTHGTGCTLSSAIASYLARGCSLSEAARKGRIYVWNAISAGVKYKIGHGHGPVHHFYAHWG